MTALAGCARPFDDMGASASRRTSVVEISFCTRLGIPVYIHRCVYIYFWLAGRCPARDDKVILCPAVETSPGFGVNTTQVGRANQSGAEGHTERWRVSPAGGSGSRGMVRRCRFDENVIFRAMSAAPLRSSIRMIRINGAGADCGTFHEFIKDIHRQKLTKPTTHLFSEESPVK